MSAEPRNVVEPVSDLKLQIVRDLVRKAIAAGPSSREARILEHLAGHQLIAELIARIDARERPQ